MTPQLPPPRSYWLDSAPPVQPPPISAAPPEVADVAVLGGGIAGITTAYLLAQSGYRVVLIEARQLLEGVTGNTTAKVSAQHGLVYADLTRRFDAETAAAYGASHLAAAAWIGNEASRLGVQCEWSVRDSFVYAEAEGEAKLHEEAEAAANAGLPASFVRAVDLPYPVLGAVRFAGQAQFHPVRWLRALAGALAQLGGTVVQGVRARDVTEDDPCVVHTDAGEYRARHVVVATHYPILDRGFYFARMAPTRELVVAGPLPADRPPLAGMYLSSDTGHSVRTAPLPDGRLLGIVLGEHYRPGAESDVEERHARLAEWAWRRLGIDTITHRWSAQDNTTVDRLPYIGRYSRRSERLWVATGFGQWGMTGGTLAALILRDLIAGAKNPWAELYDPARLTVRASMAGFVKDNAAVAEHLVVDRVKALLPHDPQRLAPGEATVCLLHGRLAAVRRTESGELVALSARCTHLGCAVAFNDDERSWDCPCHGSRFSLDGSVLHGPATAPLEALHVE